MQSNTPANDQQLEQAVLGAMLIEQQAITDFMETCTNPAVFYAPKHQEIFKAMIKLSEKGDPIDLITVNTEIRSKNKSEMTGGASYLSELTSKINSAAHIQQHALLLTELYLRRESHAVAIKMQQNSLNNETDVFEMMDSMEQMLFDLRGEVIKTSYSSIGQVAKDYFKELESRIQLTKEGKMQGVPSGILGLDKVTGGWKAPDLIIIAARPGMGKAQRINELVLSDQGWIKNKDIKIGTKVAGSDGNFHNVTGVFPQGVRDYYKVTFDDGTWVECDLEHLWLTRSREERKRNKPATEKTLKQIIDSGIYVNGTKRKNHTIEFCKPVNFREKKLDIHPYLLGVLLGDGTLTQKTICVSNPEIDVIDRIKDCLPISNSFTLGQDGLKHYLPVNKSEKNVKNLRDYLTDYKLFGTRSNTKFIPEIYKFGSVEQRLDLLQGLVDTDGYIVEQGKGKWTGNVIEYSTVSKQLADDVAELARSLGGRVSVKDRIGRYKMDGEYIETQKSYRLYMSFPESITPFKSFKHARRYTPAKRFHQKFIVDVEKVGQDEMQCISVDAPDRQYITKDYILTHNTALTLSILRNAAVQFNEPVAIFSLEMSKIQLTERLISAESEIDHKKLKHGDLNSQDLNQLTRKTNALMESNIFIDDTPGITLMELKAKARKLKKNEGIKMIAVDYLQLMRGGGQKNGNREQEISAISRGLKELAKEIDVPVIALSQLSRAVEQRGGDKRPQLSDLRESGSIEQDADMVSFIFRPEYYGITEDENGNDLRGMGEFIIAKHRSGDLETIPMKFIGRYIKYTDINDYDSPTKAEPKGQAVHSLDYQNPIQPDLNGFEEESPF